MYLYKVIFYLLSINFASLTKKSGDAFPLWQQNILSLLYSVLMLACEDEIGIFLVLIICFLFIYLNFDSTKESGHFITGLKKLWRIAQCSFVEYLLSLFF